MGLHVEVELAAALTRANAIHAMGGSEECFVELSFSIVWIWPLIQNGIAFRIVGPILLGMPTPCPDLSERAVRIGAYRTVSERACMDGRCGRTRSLDRRHTQGNIPI